MNRHEISDLIVLASIVAVLVTAAFYIYCIATGTL